MKLLPFAALRKVPFIVYLWILQAFLLVNAPVIAPAGQVDSFRTILIIYMVLQIAFYTLSPRIPGLQMNLNAAIIWFVGAFVVTTFVLVGIQGLRGTMATQTYAVGASTYLIVMHACVVAVSEEVIFRGSLPLLISPIPAQIAFGLFHWSAYGGDLTSLLIAIFAGFLFYVIMRKTNIWTTMGIHAAYNLVVLGAWI
jgi:membrane protease YdiL (CAAX protease family)